MEFRQAQLDNGLTIVAEVNPDAASLALGFFVQTGSRDETPAVAGVSHFLEHMAFKGTERRSSLDVNRELDEMGAESNAGTAEENTVYYASVLPEFQDRAADLLADILRPSLRPEDFDAEKRVILDEIAVYDDQPHFRVYEKIMGEYFLGHPLGQSILGTRESIGALSRQDMLGYFQRRYAAGNITAVAAGRVDFDRLAATLGRLCGGWPAGDAPRARPPAPQHRARKTIVDKKVVRQHIGLMSAAPSAEEDARYAAQLLAAIVGDSTGSRLYYALVETALADEASTSYSPMDGAGAFLTFLSCDPDKAGLVRRTAEAELARFMDQGPTEEELRAAQNKIATGVTMKGELPIGRLSDIGFDCIYRKEYLPLEEQIDRMFAVTRQDVRELAWRSGITDCTLLTLGPVESV